MRITKSQLQKIVKEEIQTEWNSGEETDESFKDVMTQDSYLRVIEMLQEILEDSRERLENRAYSGVHLTEKISDILRLLERGY